MKSHVAAAAVASVLAVCSALTWSAEGVAESLLPSDIQSLPTLDVEVPRVSALVDAFGEDLIVLGRVDGTVGNQELFVVGQQVSGRDLAGFAVGDYVAVLGERAGDGTVVARSVFPVGSDYVPGASSVFVRGNATQGLSSLGRADVGGQSFDLTPMMSSGDLFEMNWSSADFGVVGVQPVIGGLVLARDIAFANKAGGSLGTGRTSGSLGTGKSSNGSLGTGRTSGSLGTGKSSNGSLGTGKSAK